MTSPKKPVLDPRWKRKVTALKAHLDRNVLTRNRIEIALLPRLWFTVVADMENFERMAQLRAAVHQPFDGRMHELSGALASLSVLNEYLLRDLAGVGKSRALAISTLLHLTNRLIAEDVVVLPDGSDLADVIQHLIDLANEREEEVAKIDRSCRRKADRMLAEIRWFGLFPVVNVSSE